MANGSAWTTRNGLPRIAASTAAASTAVRLCSVSSTPTTTPAARESSTSTDPRPWVCRAVLMLIPPHKDRLLAGDGARVQPDHAVGHGGDRRVVGHHHDGV